jgi:ketosteroid isomerase-like protein
VPVAARQALLCEFRDGKISRIRSYLDPDEALRDAGLRE